MTVGASHSRRAFLAVAGTLAGSALSTAIASDAASAPVQKLVKPAHKIAFSESMRGNVLYPGASDYDAARRVKSHNPGTDHYPAIIARCADGADVSKAIRFAREHGLEIAVRSGGHDVLGQSTTAGGLLVDMGSMRRIDVSANEPVVRIEAGVLAGQLNNTLQDHGLAVPLGCHPGVGVAGLTLGGGLGWLLGRYGATCDNVLAMDVITAEGREVRVSADIEPQLFWALRGGGGNFGVVTAIEFQTHPVGEVVRGFVVYSAKQTKAFLHFYHDFMTKAPDELTAEVTIVSASEPIIALTFCYAGDERKARQIIDPLLRFGPPLAEDVALVPFARLTDIPPEIGRQFAAPADQAESPAPSNYGFNYWQGASLSDWDEASVDAFDERLQQAPVGYSIGLGHYMHGEISRVEDDATPIIRRDGSYSYFFNANWGRPVDADRSMSWVNESISSMSQFSNPTYVNYLSSGDASSVQDTYGGNYKRLRDIKALYDPENVFHLNRNIRPS
jgi:FAD/FMN-containing dehydrogenase